MKETIDIFPTPTLTVEDGQLILLFPGAVLGVSAAVDPAMQKKMTQALGRTWNSCLLAFQRDAWNVFTGGTKPSQPGVGAGVPGGFE